MSYLICFLGAGLGGGLRHGVNMLALRWFGTQFPYGTLFVNVVGSLAMGLLAGWFAYKVAPNQAWRLFLTTGVLGGFTTFSTFSLDVVSLYQRGAVINASLYLVVSVGLSIAAVLLGLSLVRQFG